MAKLTQIMPEQGSERRRLHLREISAGADTPLETVGQDLRAARLRKGEHLATVSSVLKIRKDHLDALEESNFEALPGRTYALGFIRSYADYLGLDSKRFVERFKAETAGRWGQEEAKLSLDNENEGKLPRGILILALLLVIAVAYGGYYLTVAASRMLADPVTAVPARLTAQAAPPPAPAAPPEPAASTPAQAALEAASSTASDLPDGQEYGTKNADSRVTLRVYVAAKILVQGPGNKVYLNRTLAAGDSYRAPNASGVTLTTPDSGAIEVIVDGNSLGFLGAKGAIAEGLSLSPQDLVGRYPPRRPG